MPKTTLTGKPDAGNLHVRFDEGEGGISLLYSTIRIDRMRKCGKAAAALQRKKYPVHPNILLLFSMENQVFSL